MFLKIKDIQIRISINRVVRVKGFNNFLPNNKFFPVWDFDDLPLTDVIKNLSHAQYKWGLTNIYIVESSPKHYHAICFQSMNWSKCLKIIFGTEGLDKMFVALALARGYATLRMSQRTNNSIVPHIIHKIQSNVPDEVNEIRPQIKGVEYDTRTK